MSTLATRKDQLNRAVDREIDFHVLYSTYANNVKYIRRQLNMTQQQFADMLEWSRGRVGMIEEGRSLDLKNIIVLAKTARVSLDTILLTDMRNPAIDKGVSEAVIKADEIKQRLIAQGALLNDALKSIQLANTKINEVRLNAGSNNA